ncbi:MAG: cell division protein FtsK [Desulfosporosinus sp. BRH_c37]|nr:MAG: cell division protein FtsK [Desulfosporosinus sp. BRH_c37]
MSKREKESSSFWLKFVSGLILLFAFAGLLGSFGFSIGKRVYSFFTVVMGSLAWAGPLLCLIVAFLLWIYSPNLTSFFLSVRSGALASSSSSKQPGNRRKMQPDKGISLPAGKLVNLQGFDQYFFSPEMVEMKDSDVQMAEELKEIGRDFPSYFGTGESFYPKKLGKMTSLKGLKDYIEEVDEEARFEREIPWQDNYTPKEIPKKPTGKPAKFSSVFKSQTDQEEFLAQFKQDESLLNPEELNVVGAFSESCGTIDVSEEIVHQVESSSSEDILELELEVELDTVVKEELTNEFELVNDLSAVHLDLACSSMELEVLEDPIPPVVTLKPRQEVFAARLDDLTPEKVDQWKLPDFQLLDPVIKRVIIQDTETPKQLEKVLLDFGVKAKVIRVARGPVITRYELAPAPGVKISKIVNLADDIALGLAARDVRIEAPIPGKAAIGIEVPNKQARAVPFREVLETISFGEYSSKLKVALGKDIADQPIIGDLIKMPHLLVAGATGSGKSVCITSIINSILYNANPDEVKFLLVDPKMVELSQYNGIPHLLAPVVIDPKKAASALKWIVKEMENRYELFAAAGVRDIERYNKMKAGETINRKPALPLIVVIIDELADLMLVAAGEVEEAICRLAQMARAAGIHLVIATQRPSVDVITGVIKANIPSRISFAVSSQIDSRTILDATGAEKLLGRGDMLYSPLGVNKALRVQGCLVTDDEVERVITHWKELGRPEYLDPEHLFAETTLKNEESNGPDDVLFLDAGQLFIKTGIASVSFLQRKLKLGYTRAARLMDMLQEQGVVGTYEGSKPRQVLLTLEEFNERFG